MNWITYLTNALTGLGAWIIVLAFIGVVFLLALLVLHKLVFDSGSTKSFTPRARREFLARYEEQQRSTSLYIGRYRRHS